MAKYRMHEITASGFWAKPEGFIMCALLLFWFLRSLALIFDVEAYLFLRFSRWVVPASHSPLYPPYFS